ncbi:MAG: diguanylate cyclase [Treponema sp.]|nr:diguanylate cyclase [Treponema sp.]
MNKTENVNLHARAEQERNKLITGVIILSVLTVLFVIVSYMDAPIFVILPVVVAVFTGGAVFAIRTAKKLEMVGFEEGMHLVMEGVPMNCTITDDKGKVLFCNERSMAMFDINDKQEYSAKLFGDFLPEIQPDGTRSLEKAGGHIQMAFKKGVETFEWWHQMGPGKNQFPCSITLAGAEVYGMKRLLVFNTDLRKARELERQEAALKERMQAILDSSPMLCAHYDGKGDIIDVNREAEDMFGITNKQIFIDNITRFLPKTQPDGTDSIQKNAMMVEKAIREGSLRYEWMYLHSDGSQIPVEEIVEPIKIDGEQHVFVYSRDLREFYQERERERVVQGKLQAMMGQFNEYVEEQSSSVATSSSATEQMIANVQSVTDTLSKNTQNVKNLEEASIAGHASLNEVITDIQGIANESESLLQINSVMQNIASQTNLLSMNASIEAAHAGDAGRGFAVVADEIRKLAESSSKQSKTIGGVLKSIKESIDKITKSTDGVLGKFNAIEDGVKIVAVQEANIVSAMEEQRQGSKQILQAVSHVNEVTHQVREAARRMVETSRETMHKTDDAETQAYTDDLTGVRNKEYFMENAARELRYCVDEERDFNMVAFGIDNMRQLIDDHGQIIMDEAQKILTQRVRNSLKQGTLVARYSDEDFIITLPNVRYGTAVKLAEQIQKKVKDAPFTTKGQRLDISISLGIATKTGHSRTLRDIVSNAERALANARVKGRNKIATYGHAI